MMLDENWAEAKSMLMMMARANIAMSNILFVEKVKKRLMVLSELLFLKSDSSPSRF